MERFNKAETCEECGIRFGEERKKMVTLASGEKKEKVFIARKCRDHDHFTGRYRAALCDNCNFGNNRR
jgi:hypothetical protein